MSELLQLQPEVLVELPLGSEVGQFRYVPVRSDERGNRKTILFVYSQDPNIDPFGRFFRFPKDSVKLIMFDDNGDVLWRKNMGDSVIPGVWFFPVFPFDLDGDGVDEIYCVKNNDSQHPLNVKKYVLERLDARTGETTGQWEWPFSEAFYQSMTRAFRYFIIGGHVHGEPVLVTAQGTYGMMNLQAWNPDMSRRWELHIPDDGRGARGSHVTPVVDINGDGIDELMWGERCIELDRGTELFCADREVYKGHSDVILPILDRSAGRWLLYTAREQDMQASPRVVMFDDQGRRLWGAVDHGHMHWSWVARLADNGSFVCMAARQAAEGHMDGEFLFEALSGKEIRMNASVYGSLPVDFNGDGYHELARNAKAETEIMDRTGRVISRLRGNLSQHSGPGSKLLDYPGEQIVTVDSNGVLRIWGDAGAEDCPEALERYRHPYYTMNQKMTAVGYNRLLLGGI